MHHLKLTKGLSYMGAVSATKDKPDVFVEDEARYKRAMASGYFKEIHDSEEASSEESAYEEEETEDPETEETVDTGENLEDMSVVELTAYASVNGIDVTGLKKKADLVKAIKEAEEKAKAARESIRS